MKYQVLNKTLFGWESIWNEDKFQTLEEAKEQIKDHVKTCHEHNMECNLYDFKIVKQ